MNTNKDGINLFISQLYAIKEDEIRVNKNNKTFVMITRCEEKNVKIKKKIKEIANVIDKNFGA